MTSGRVRSTQVGSWPGTDHHLALRIAFEETADLPVLPELPDRGPYATMIGRATALLPELSVDLQPAGWRLIHGHARDHRRAHQLVRDDLERLEERAQGFSGAVKVAVTGPWTLAASIDLPMGEKVLSDHGARRDVGDSLVAGIADLRADLARRLPDITWVVQLDEPMLPLVSRGEVRTDSGLHRYRAIDEPELVRPITAVTELGPTWLHSCAPDLPLSWLARVPGLALSVDESLVDTAGWDVLGAALDAGRTVALGTDADGPDDLARRTLRRLERLGLGPEVAERLWLTPTCGLANRTETDAVRELRQLSTAAAIVTETLQTG